MVTKVSHLVLHEWRYATQSNSVYLRTQIEDAAHRIHALVGEQELSDDYEFSPVALATVRNMRMLLNDLRQFGRSPRHRKLPAATLTRHQLANWAVRLSRALHATA